MARIVGIDIPKNKKVPYALRYIHGIGIATAKNLCSEAKVDINTRVRDLTEKQVVAIRDAIANLSILVEGELRSQTAMNIKRLKPIGDFATGRVFQQMDKELKQMQGREKGKKEL